MFFKVGVLKNCAILEPVSDKVAGLLLGTPTVDASGFSSRKYPFSA